jgi:phage baseplate assembly protein W
MSGISPKLPLLNSRIDGAYELNKTIKETIKQNLKNMLLTHPGERVMDPLFGLGLGRYLFENSTTFIAANVKSDLIFQLEKYMPFIELINFSGEAGNPLLGESDNLLKIKVEFLIKPLDEVDNLLINSDSN